jgi:linoleoyl-CoA desaturase
MNKHRAAQRSTMAGSIRVSLPTSINKDLYTLFKMKKIRFNQANKNGFNRELFETARRYMSIHGLQKKAHRRLIFKLTFFSSAYILLYLLAMKQDGLFFMAGYILFSLSGILLAFNAAHDAAHGTVSRHKFINDMIFRFTFNLQGVNSYLWKKRHIASHHLFPNVDGCDADIDENPLLRLSPVHRMRAIHKFQHIYATLLYAFYTLHWIFFKDFLYLRKKELSNLRHIQHPALEIFRFFLWKFIYLFFYIAMPLALGHSLSLVLATFVISHFIISIFFVWTLIISHLTMETSFPVQNTQGQLPFDYYAHQLSTSMDYRPENKMMNWFLGGFNAHAAHHLFPKQPHTMNRQLTKLIKRLSSKYKMPYNCKTFIGALISHYRYLRKMGVS